MTPGSIIKLEPESTNEFRQGYKEGYEAGKASIKKELKELIKTLSDKEPYTVFTTTGNYLNQTL